MSYSPVFPLFLMEMDGSAPQNDVDTLMNDSLCPSYSPSPFILFTKDPIPVHTQFELTSEL